MNNSITLTKDELNISRVPPGKYRVLNMADISACPDVFHALESIAEVVTLPPDPESLRARLPEFDAYFASLHVRVTRDILQVAPRLRVIATPSTGTDHIDMTATAESGIAVLSLKNDRDFLDRITTTAELAWGLLLATVRRLPWAFAAAQNGDWARDRFRGMQISGKTLGILGYGRLGSIVAEYGRAFRMRVLACDIRKISPAPDITMTDFQTLIKESDVLSIHVHLSDATRGLLDEQAFAAMRPGAILINTSRGAVVDEAALLRALESGRLAGAGLDVVDGEWNVNLREHPLVQYARTHENLVITPHIGGVTRESQAMAYTFTAEKLLRQFQNKELSKVL